MCVCVCVCMCLCLFSNLHFLSSSHFDVVTSVVFHPTEPVLVTGSQDCTLKLWNLATQNKKYVLPVCVGGGEGDLILMMVVWFKCSFAVCRSAIVDVEPTCTFRGHTYVSCIRHYLPTLGLFLLFFLLLLSLFLFLLLLHLLLLQWWCSLCGHEHRW